MIQDEGIVSTGAGTHSPHPLQVTAKSHNWAGSLPNMEPSIGEEKAKCLAQSRGTTRGPNNIEEQEDGGVPVLLGQQKPRKPGVP